MKAYGLSYELNYKSDKGNNTCRVKKNLRSDIKSDIEKLLGHVLVQPNDVDQLLAAVQLGPVSIAVNSGTWQFYSEGTVEYSNILPNTFEELGHQALLVGYTENKFIVKNSWGSSWGEGGYINLQRGDSAINTCGILNRPSYPLI
jgi:hypothetical protein